MTQDTAKMVGMQQEYDAIQTIAKNCKRALLYKDYEAAYRYAVIVGHFGNVILNRIDELKSIEVR